MTKIEKHESGDRAKLHRTHLVAKYRTLQSDSGSALLQLDTYGSADREIPGKVSQTLQFDQESAEQLWLILGKTFGFGTRSA